MHKSRRAAINHLTGNLTMKDTSKTKLSIKGHVVLPKPLSVSRRWKPGTEFVIEDRDKGVLLRPKSDRGARSWESIVGSVRYSGPRKSIREMDEAVSAQARSRK